MVTDMPQKSDEPTFDIEAAYPNVAEWVAGCGWIEIGDQDWQGFVVRALNEGGMTYEKQGCSSLTEAMAALETGLGKWFEENN
jgi:hypothetical protein